MGESWYFFRILFSGKCPWFIFFSYSTDPFANSIAVSFTNHEYSPCINNLLIAINQHKPTIYHLLAIYQPFSHYLSTIDQGDQPATPAMHQLQAAIAAARKEAPRTQWRFQWEIHGNMFYEWRFSVGKSYKKECSSAMFDGGPSAKMIRHWYAMLYNPQG